jgi:hypothetical protein
MPSGTGRDRLGGAETALAGAGALAGAVLGPYRGRPGDGSTDSTAALASTIRPVGLGSFEATLAGDAQSEAVEAPLGSKVPGREGTPKGGFLRG